MRHVRYRYQLEGVNWMASNWARRRNVLLADEMGLGKTAQVVATLGLLRAKHKLAGPFLVVAPLSTLQHWQREIEQVRSTAPPPRSPQV